MGVANLELLKIRERLLAQALVWRWPEIDIQLNVEWGSLNSDHRKLIKNELAAELEGAVGSSTQSISHCPGAGGFVRIRETKNFQKNIGIGFDIEQVDRVTPSVARRICLHDEEFQNAPNMAALWVAKEAAYKSLQNYKQPTTAFGLEVGHWTHLDEGLFGVEVLNKSKFERARIEGLVVIAEKLAASIFFSAL